MAAAGPALLLGAVVAAAFAVDAAASTPSAAFAVQLEKRADPSRRRLGATVGAVEVADCENVEYTGMIGLGTPIQEFRVVLSIATSYVWVGGCRLRCNKRGVVCSVDSSSSYSRQQFVFPRPQVARMLGLAACVALLLHLPFCGLYI